MLKRIDFEKKELIGKSGKTYFIEEEVTVVRFQEFEKLQTHVGFGVDFSGVVNKLKDAYKKLNDSKPMDAGIILHNLMNGIVHKIENRSHPIMELCALFVNEKDEDRGVVNKDEMKRKIDDWDQYSANDFFQLAFSLVKNLIPVYEEISQSISQQKKTEKKNTIKSK